MNRWYPNASELDSVEDLKASFKQLLDQHYALVDKVNAQGAKSTEPAKPAASGPLPGHGPADTMICGLPVLPVDAQSLADATKLTYVKKSGNFQFK
jgi:hypothetical protein